MQSASAETDGRVVLAPDGVVAIANLPRMLTEVRAAVDWGETPEAGRQEISVALCRSGTDLSAEEERFSQTLSAENGWSCVWYDLPLYTDGSIAEYTLREKPVGTVDGAPASVADDTGRFVEYDGAFCREDADGGYDRTETVWLDSDGAPHYAGYILLRVRSGISGAESSSAAQSDGGETLPDAVYTLPSTGGVGILLPTLLGAVILSLAAALAVFRRRPGSAGTFEEKQKP